MRTVAFSVSANGMGHLVRCGALAAQLNARGWQHKMLRPGEKTQADVLVTDPPGPGGFTEYLVGITDTPYFKTEQVMDVLVCGSPGARSDDFVGFAKRRLLIGPKYAILRPQFAQWRRLGGDCKPQGIFDARAISGMLTKDLIARLTNAELTITYGGMRALEAACVGAPMIVVPRNEGERLNARGLASAGGAVVADEKSAESIAQSILGSTAMLKAMSKACLDLVDGLGCERVIASIEELAQ